MEMETCDDILSSDKLLFAVDLVDYIIMKTRPNFGSKTANILERVDRIRNCTYNRFNKTIRKALSIIDVNQDHSVYSDFQKMMDKNKVDRECFMEYASNYRKLNLSDGFHSKSFLMYCDRIANMAGYFISYGVDDAADIAVELIMQAFPQTVMYYRTWNDLTEVAEMLETLGNDYYGDMSSDSSSESSDVVSNENDDSSVDSVNMDEIVTSPEGDPGCVLDSDTSGLRKTSIIMSAIKSPSPRYRPFKNNQTSDSVSSFKYPRNDGGPDSPDEIDMSNSGS